MIVEVLIQSASQSDSGTFIAACFINLCLFRRVGLELFKHLPKFSVDLVSVVAGYAVDVLDTEPQSLLARRLDVTHAHLVLVAPSGDVWAVLYEDIIIYKAASGATVPVPMTDERKTIYSAYGDIGRLCTFDKVTEYMLRCSAEDVAVFDATCKRIATIQFTRPFKTAQAMRCDSSGLYVLKEDDKKYSLLQGRYSLVHIPLDLQCLPRDGHRTTALTAPDSRLFLTWPDCTPLTLAVSQTELFVLVHMSVRRSTHVLPRSTYVIEVCLVSAWG